MTQTTAQKNRDEEIRRRNKDSVQKAAFFWIKLANDRLSEINKQLLSIAFILLPLTGSIVLANKKINFSDKTLLTHGWILLFISIFSGLIQILIDAIYFKSLSRDSSKREKIWSQIDKPISLLASEEKELGEVKGSSTHWPLIIQSFTMFIGLGLIMIVAYHLLSNNISYIRHFKGF